MGEDGRLPKSFKRSVTTKIGTPSLTVRNSPSPPVYTLYDLYQWEFFICDNSEEKGGNLNGWNIRLTFSGSGPCRDSIFTYFLR